jgi:glutathione S-transferase
MGMKLYRFRYSPYARKVQILLDLLGATYDVVEVPYSHVPVLALDDGTVLTESRRICAHLLRSPSGERLVPPPWEGPIWAYADFTDGPLEEPMFRIASPKVRDAWPSVSDRALYVLVKERKFGAGCVDAWERDRATLIAEAQTLLAPTLRTLAARPFLFGDAPTLADAALYGTAKMVEEVDSPLLAQIAEPLLPFLRRVESAAAAVMKG